MSRTNQGANRMSSSDSQDTPSTSSYTDSNTFSDPTSASSTSETVSTPAEPQQFQPPAPFTPPPPFEPPAPFEVPSPGAPPAPPAEPFAQAIDPLTAEPVPPPEPSYATPDASVPPVYTPAPLPAAYPAQPYGQPYNPYAASAAPRSQDNGMAIAGLVCSLVGICSCVTVIVGLILGHIGLAKANRGEAGGRGMALAAVVIAYIVIALYVGFGGTMIILGVNGELD
ncbi:hypothetical protein H074_19817 [Amycolatopsis decaplanina DSM 44594]|uniref:DUF4190 domain-containing protein n=2 Tax=Amycolatopsis decaplanina TaxID=208441 RepID=M2YRI6_9PSEU|nr:hypothetical protein H074_19817 [Amycolatopsis decaplanina DSM 44594]